MSRHQYICVGSCAKAFLTVSNHWPTVAWRNWYHLHAAKHWCCCSSFEAQCCHHNRTVDAISREMISSIALVRVKITANPPAPSICCCRQRLPVLASATTDRVSRWTSIQPFTETYAAVMTSRSVLQSQSESGSCCGSCSVAVIAGRPSTWLHSSYVAG